jgi:PBP1b-binding outer membrane lipoprotein LpoB
MKIIVVLAVALICVCCSTEDSVPVENQRVYESVNAQPVKPYPIKGNTHQ